MIEWQEDVRRRLEAGETITAGQIRQLVGRHVNVYDFIERLRTNEGWVIQERLYYPPNFCQFPVKHFRLVRKKKRVKPPVGTGPRVHMPVRPTEIIAQRLLAGETLENQVVAQELGVTNSAMTYVKRRLEAQGYKFDTRRVGYRVFTVLKPSKVRARAVGFRP